MFGSSLPVCAIQFPTISELVKHGYNGLIFNNALELTNQLERLLFTNNSKTTKSKDKDNEINDGKKNSKNVEIIYDEDVGGDELSTLRKGAGLIESWDDNWDVIMPPLIASWLDL
jgi:beta-1,4-mannosyltransferase